MRRKDVEEEPHRRRVMMAAINGATAAVAMHNMRNAQLARTR